MAPPGVSNYAKIFGCALLDISRTDSPIDTPSDIKAKFSSLVIDIDKTSPPVAISPIVYGFSLVLISTISIPYVRFAI